MPSRAIIASFFLLVAICVVALAYFVRSTQISAPYPEQSTERELLGYAPTPTTSQDTLLRSQLDCSQLEVHVILHYLHNYNSTPSNFSSRSHFDTRLNKCFVELRYSEYCGAGYEAPCDVSALYDATNNILLECYNPDTPSPEFQTGCDDPNHLGIQVSTTTYDRTLEKYMSE